eukprot:1430681-Pleurochrysis_carterae.AAC.2
MASPNRVCLACVQRSSSQAWLFPRAALCAAPLKEKLKQAHDIYHVIVGLVDDFKVECMGKEPIDKLMQVNRGRVGGLFLWKYIYIALLIKLGRMHAACVTKMTR